MPLGCRSVDNVGKEQYFLFGLEAPSSGED